MRHSFRLIHSLLTVFTLAGPVFAQPATSPQPNLTLTGALEGSRVAVFDTKKDSCALIDIPDAPARAFVDYQGMVHLVSSYYVMRASLGPTLESRDFDVAFADPYLGPVTNPFDHIFTPIPMIGYVNAINFHPASNLFIATLIDPYDTFYGPPGLYLSTSPDLINWTQATLVVTIADLLAKEPKGNWSYAYFSLLDPNSTDANFSTITDSPYLYYVRSDDNHGPYVRVLFRQKIKLTWSQN